MSTPSQSAADRAMNAKPPVRKLFGQMIHVECIDVGFDEDQHRYTPWNPAVHSRQQPRTQIKMEAEVYKRLGTYVAKKEMIDNGKEWQDITRASMIKLNLTLTNLQERWVEIELRRTGRTWEDKNTGETKYAEAFYFVRAFKSRDECDNAYAEHIGAPADTDQGDNSNGASDQPSAGSDQADAMMRGAATIWQVTQQNPDVFKATITANPMLIAHFGNADAALAYVQGGAETPATPPPAAPKQRKNAPQPVAASAGTAAGSSDEEEDLPF